MLRLLNKECLLCNYFKRNIAVDQINEFLNFYSVLTRCQESCHPRLSRSRTTHSPLMTSSAPIASSPILHANNPQSQLSLNHRASCPLDICFRIAHFLTSSTCPKPESFPSDLIHFLYFMFDCNFRATHPST